MTKSIGGTRAPHYFSVNTQESSVNRVKKFVV
jgi:hypothetical protein